MVHRLSEYPFVVLRLRCDACERQGSFRTVRLAAKWGSEISLGKLLFKLSADCAWRREKHSYRTGDGCHVYYPDLRGPPRPPDLPPGLAKLYLVQGGKADQPAEEPEEAATNKTRKAIP